MTSGKVLVVDDDPSLRAAIGRALRFEGYDVSAAEDGAEAVERLDQSPVDLIVLDITMPRIDGHAVTRYLRGGGDATPILMLTARDGVADRVRGLDAGADDYLPKPFALEEFLARVRALLRRAAPVGDDGTLRCADLVVEPAGRTVTRGGRRVELTRTEFDLLEVLVRNAGRVMRRDVLFERVWGYDLELSSNSLDVYVGYLRRKTEEGGEPRLLHTVRGVGFVLRS